MAPSALPPDKIENLLRLVKCASHNSLGESAAELGVYLGGGTEMIAKLLPHKTVYGFDTFEGIPTAGRFDTNLKGWFKTSFDSVRKSLSQYRNIKLVRGVFPRSAQGVNDRFCFVHVDADVYQSTKDAIQFFFPRLAVNGIMLFDDYDWYQCPGVRIAIQTAFRNSAAIRQEYIGNSQYVVTKLSQSITERGLKIF